MKKIAIALSLATVITVGFFGAKYLNSEEVKAEETNTQKTPVLEAHANFIDDFSNKKKLVGAVDNVFVGKVINQVGTKSLGGAPETQFAVQVTDNIKGNLSGEVKVNQQGGYHENEDGLKELILIEGDKLLESGKTYLFATRYLESEGWNTLVPALGDIPIDGELKKENLVKEFKEAHKNEITSDVFKVIKQKNE